MDRLALSPTQWLNPYWFRPDVLAGFSWENRYFLWAIPAIPVFYILKWVLHFKWRERIDIAFFAKQQPRDRTAWLRFFPPGVQSFFLAFLLVALARPQRTSELAEEKSEGIDIVIAVDISESMRAPDLRPNRLEAAKAVAAEFVKGRPVDRIGLVVFAGDAFSMAPLTNDYSLLQDYIDDIDFSLITKPGTAIGSALAVCTNRMIETKSKSKVVVLLSDGDNTAGNLDPITAAELAASYGIKIYTISVGQDVDMGAATDLDEDVVTNSVDVSTLQKIARIGSGLFFRATNNRALEQIFKKIDQLERSEVRVRRFKQTQDYYTVYLNWAVVFLLAYLALKSTFMVNALED